VDRKALSNGWYIVAAVLAVFAIQSWWIESQQVETIPYRPLRVDDGRGMVSTRVTASCCSPRSIGQKFWIRRCCGRDAPTARCWSIGRTGSAVQQFFVHAKEVKLAEGVDLDVIAALTSGFTGADLANLVNEAALRATRRGADAVSTDDFTGAVERIVAGIEKRSRLLNPHEREVVAYHEMGHAIVATALPGMDPVHKVSMIPRGVGALGYSSGRPRTASCCRAATWKTDWPSFSAAGPPRCWSSMRHPPERPTI
jgi:hypothetical protein